MKYLLFAAILLIGLANSCDIGPCSSKSSFLKHHEKFVQETIKNGDDYKAKDWEEKDKEYQKLMDECYEKYQNDLTTREKREIWKNNTRYTLKKASDDITANMTDFSDELNEFFEEDFSDMIADFKQDLHDVFDEDFKNEIREIFDEEFKDDLKSAMQDLRKGLEEVGNELRYLFDEIREDNE